MAGSEVAPKWAAPPLEAWEGPLMSVGLALQVLGVGVRRGPSPS